MTKQNYAEIGQVAEELKDRDFVVMLFPCNQFLSQQGSTDSPTMKRLSKGTMDLEATEKIKMMKQVDVNGDKACEVYEFMKYNSSLFDSSTEKASPIPWNFAKFLINPKGGGVFKYYAPN